MIGNETVLEIRSAIIEWKRNANGGIDKVEKGKENIVKEIASEITEWTVVIALLVKQIQQVKISSTNLGIGAVWTSIALNKKLGWV